MIVLRWSVYVVWWMFGAAGQSGPRRPAYPRRVITDTHLVSGQVDSLSETTHWLTSGPRPTDVSQCISTRYVNDNSNSFCIRAATNLQNRIITNINMWYYYFISSELNPFKANHHLADIAEKPTIQCGKGQAVF